MKPYPTSLVVIIGMFVSFAFASVQPIHGTTITVQNINDGPGVPGNCPGASCRLRDAIAAAFDGDTINFSVSGAITLNNGELAIGKNIAISGPGALSLA